MTDLAGIVSSREVQVFSARASDVLTLALGDGDLLACEPTRLVVEPDDAEPFTLEAAEIVSALEQYGRPTPTLQSLLLQFCFSVANVDGAPDRAGGTVDLYEDAKGRKAAVVSFRARDVNGEGEAIEGALSYLFGDAMALAFGVRWQSLTSEQLHALAEGSAPEALTVH